MSQGIPAATTSKFIAGLEKSWRRLRLLLNLRADMDEAGTVEEIRANVDFKSANAWTLVFAIFVASVGLDTNSTAVIIGAMLISPLMGPIIGMGLGLGVNDSKLLRRSARNLGIAVGISIFTSTVYFLLSPLSLAQSELLARTRPTFFDVLIAFFGGAAGIVAQSRQTKGNAIPGVAIATALMPPLCTAGFGVASLNLAYVLGALFLFLINSVFICISTFLFVRFLRFAKVKIEQPEKQARTDRWIAIVAILVIIPSLLLAWQLQRENMFSNRSAKFIDTEMKFSRSFVVDREINYRWAKPTLRVSVIGDTIPPEKIEVLKAKMMGYGLPPESLEVEQASFDEDVERRLNEKLQSRDSSKKLADAKIAQLEDQLQGYKKNLELGQNIKNELAGLFPTLGEVLALSGAHNDKADFWVLWKVNPKFEDRMRINQFLRARSQMKNSKVEHSVLVPERTK